MPTPLNKPVTRRTVSLSPDHPVDVTLCPGSSDQEPEYLLFTVPRHKDLQVKVYLSDIYNNRLGSPPSTNLSQWFTWLESVIMTDPTHAPEVRQCAVDGLRLMQDKETWTFDPAEPEVI